MLKEWSSRIIAQNLYCKVLHSVMSIDICLSISHLQWNYYGFVLCIKIMFKVGVLNVPTRQGSSIVCRIRTWRREDDKRRAHMKVFRTSFYVQTSIERNSYVRFGRDVHATSFLRPWRIRTSGKLSHGPKVGRPLNVCGRLAEWVLLWKPFGNTTWNS